jgi:hypothetical protein
MYVKDFGAHFGNIFEWLKAMAHLSLGFLTPGL